MKVVKRAAKRIFTRTRIPGASYVINQYVGCEHACLYCYAKFMCRWKDYGVWGSWVEAKINAPTLVKGKHVRGRVYMSSVSDPYQPVEAELLLTQRVLTNMHKGVRLSVLTKSDLVLRDLDVLREFRDLEVGLTVSGLDRKFEPRAAAHERRVAALKTLSERGIRAYTFISPVIPHVTDVESVVRETRSFADYYWLELLNLRACGTECVRLLECTAPEGLKILSDEHMLRNYVRSLKELLERMNVAVEGIVVHQSVGRQWLVVKPPKCEATQPISAHLP